jgi:TPR repeat protein
MAMYNFGIANEKGFGNVKADLPTAIRWYRAAAAKDIDQARQALVRLGVP